jgi:hypothetical protein
MSKEHKLQSQIVMDHSQEYPEERGMLWSTLNRTLSQRDGQKQKAMGLVAGVSDLLYNKGKLHCLEVKYPGAPHSAAHIKAQFKWGEIQRNNGAEWFIITSVAGFWNAMTKGHGDGVYEFEDVKKMVESGKKTLIF